MFCTAFALERYQHLPPFQLAVLGILPRKVPYQLAAMAFHQEWNMAGKKTTRDGRDKLSKSVGIKKRKRSVAVIDIKLPGYIHWPTPRS
ncbi:MAG: hypothetical protein Hals2KO_32530 [Halioglobus sp.]